MWRPLRFLPDKLRSRRYYQPSDQGFEKTIRGRPGRLLEERPEGDK